jgi:hypothetical protein
MWSTFYFLHHCTLTIFCSLSTGFETFVPVYFLHVVFLPFTFTSQFYSYLFFIRFPGLGPSTYWRILITFKWSESSWLVSSFDWWFTYLWGQMIHETYLNNLHMKRWDMGNYNDLEPDYVIMFTFPWLGWITVQ